MALPNYALETEGSGFTWKAVMLSTLLLRTFGGLSCNSSALWQERQSNLEAWTVFAGRTSRKHLETPYCQEAKAQGREGEWMGYGGKNGGLFL